MFYCFLCSTSFAIKLFLNSFSASSFSSPLSRLPGWMVATLFSALCSRAWILSPRSRTHPLAPAMHQLSPSPSPPLARSPSKTLRSSTPSFEINYLLALWLCLECATNKEKTTRPFIALFVTTSISEFNYGCTWLA